MKTEISKNRAFVVGNSAQGEFPRVLCVCSASVLRSPTAAWVFSNPPFNFNTRCCGVDDDYALIKLDAALIMWAEYAIVCMESWQSQLVEDACKFVGVERDIYSLNIPDDYNYRDPALVKMIEVAGREIFLDVSQLVAVS